MGVGCEFYLMKNNPRYSLFICVFALLSPWLSAEADVYKFVGRNGQVIYTDTPRHKGYKLVIKSREPEVKPVTISLGAGRRTAGSPEAEMVPKVLTAGASPLVTPTRLTPPNSLRSRRIQYADVIQKAAFKHGLDPALLHAVIQTESAYNPGAVSHKGAMGLMQLMPGTAARYGVKDPYDPEDNIFGGARYLRDLLGMFGADVKLAVAAYNAGEHNVMKYGYQIPPFSETKDYVSRVLGLYYRYN